MIRAIIIILAVTSLIGCAQRGSVFHEKPDLSLSAEERWQLMIGNWLGEAVTESGDKRQWLVQRFADGTYRVDFVLAKEDGAIEKSSELGHWAVSGPVYFTSFRGWLNGDSLSPSDPSDPYNYDAYRILQLNNEVFEYEHIATGKVFKVTRPPSGFTLAN